MLSAGVIRCAPVYEPSAAELDGLFPAECHFKVIAVDLLGVHRNLNRCLADLGIGDHAFQPSNKSKAGKYICYEASITIDSRGRMREIDAALRAVEGVKMVL
jgi:putative lipoic acid-binding regulatory protein